MDTVTPPASDPTPLRGEVVREAARWLAAMHSGRFDEGDAEACQLWRTADPEHERAWQRALRFQGPLAQVPPPLVRAALEHQPMTRRGATGAAAALLLAVPVAWWTWRTPEAGEANTLSTATGERRNWILADGTRVWLNTATHVKTAYDAGLRRVVLLQGEIMVETAADATRPFVIVTRQGTLRALGTRFLVRDVDSDVHLSVYQGAVQVEAAQVAPAVVQANQTLDLSPGALPQPAHEDGAAWMRGQLVARDLPLTQFIAVLTRHRHGRLHCDPALATLRISGVFQLDQSDAILAALPRTLPVQVVWRTRWWVSVEPVGGQKES